jgi:ankyrin repeat protein
MLLQNTNNYLLSDEVLKAIKAAAISNNLANVQRFFDVSYPGLDPNYIYLSTEDEGGDNLTQRSLLHYAAARGRHEVVAYLLSKNARPNITTIKENREAEWVVIKEFNETPLHLAVASGNYELVSMLIDAGADINKVDDLDMSPLQIAQINGYSQIAQMLMNSGAEQGLFSYDNSLVGYARRGNIDGLMSLSPNPELHETNTDFNYKAIHWAAANGHKEVVQYLLNRGIDPNSPTNLGGKDTALIVAAQNGRQDIIQYLRAIGVPANQENAFGITPKQAALQNGYLELLDLLS